MIFLLCWFQLAINEEKYKYYEMNHGLAAGLGGLGKSIKEQKAQISIDSRDKKHLIIFPFHILFSS